MREEVDFNLLQRKFKQLLSELYQDSREISVFVTEVKHAVGTSSPYQHEGEVLADYVDIIKIKIKAEISHKIRT